MSTYTVWKYSIDPGKINDNCEIDLELPPGAKILHVGTQIERSHPGGHRDEKIRLWAKVNLDEKGSLCRRRFVVLGTGMEYNHEDRNPLSPLMIYLDTLKMSDGLVFHIFEIGGMSHAIREI